MKYVLFAAVFLLAQPLWAANYKVDYDKSSVSFTGTHAGNAFEGMFQNWQADIKFDATDLKISTIRATFDLESAKTGNKMYDGTLPKADWFDVKNHAKGVFESTSIQETGTPNSFLVEGDLSLRGTRQPVRFTFTLEESEKNTRVYSQFDINRLAFGIGQKSDAEAKWVSQNIGIELKIIATK